MRIVTFPGATSGSPDTPEWHAWRAQGIGGSDAGALALDAGLIENGPGWFKTANRLWEIKTGRSEDDFKENYATRRGRAGEPIIHRLYEERTGNIVSPVFGEMVEHPPTRSSFDGLTLDGDIIIEIKCPGEAVHQLAKDGEVVPYYRPQIVHQALTAWGEPDRWNPDREVHFCSGVPEIREIAIVPVRARRMLEMAKRLYEVEREFWERVQNDRPIAGEEGVVLEEAWAAAKMALDAAAALEKEAKQEWIAFAEASGKTKLEGAKAMLTRSTRAGSVDYSKVLAEHAPKLSAGELDAFRGAESVVWTPKLRTRKAAAPKKNAGTTVH